MIRHTRLCEGQQFFWMNHVMFCVCFLFRCRSFKNTRAVTHSNAARPTAQSRCKEGKWQQHHRPVNLWLRPCCAVSMTTRSPNVCPHRKQLTWKWVRWRKLGRLECDFIFLRFRLESLEKHTLITVFSASLQEKGEDQRFVRTSLQELCRGGPSWRTLSSHRAQVSPRRHQRGQRSQEHQQSGPKIR